MEEKFTEKDYYLHSFSHQEALEALEEELERLEKFKRKTLWFYSGKKTLERLKGGTKLLEKGRRGELPLTPHDVNNIVYVLLKKLEE